MGISGYTRSFSTAARDAPVHGSTKLAHLKLNIVSFCQSWIAVGAMRVVRCPLISSTEP
jgi:hypothetical protein